MNEATGQLKQAFKNDGRYLIDEIPLIVQPTLAVRFGLNEGIFIQKLHLMLRSDKLGKVIDGQKWVYCTEDEWLETFPFWSRNTIRRIVEKLVKAGIVQEGNYNDQLSRRKWYTINYEKMDTPTRTERKPRIDYPNFGHTMKQVKADKTRTSKVETIDHPNFGSSNVLTLDVESSSESLSVFPSGSLYAAGSPASTQIEPPRAAPNGDSVKVDITSPQSNLVLETTPPPSPSPLPDPTAALRAEMGKLLVAAAEQQAATTPAAEARLYAAPNGNQLLCPKCREPLQYLQTFKTFVLVCDHCDWSKDDGGNPIEWMKMPEPVPYTTPAADGYGPRDKLVTLADGYRWRHYQSKHSIHDMDSHIMSGKSFAPLCKHKVAYGYEDKELSYSPIRRHAACPGCVAAYAERTAPKAKQPKAPRPRDLVFDAIAAGSFGMGRVSGDGGRVGKLKKQVIECTAPEHLPTLAADLEAAYKWWRETKRKNGEPMGIPASRETICGMLREWREIKTPKSNMLPGCAHCEHGYTTREITVNGMMAYADVRCPHCNPEVNNGN